MIYGYARASTDAQDLSNQVTQLKAAGCATIFREKGSGATAERPQLKKLMAKLARGDKSTIPAGGAEFVPYRVVAKEASKDRLAVGPFRTDLEEKLGKK